MTTVYLLVCVAIAEPGSINVLEKWDGLTVCPLRRDHALFVCNEEIAKGEDVAAWLVRRSDCHYASGDLDEAAADLKNAQALGADFGATWRLLRIDLDRQIVQEVVAPSSGRLLPDALRLMRCRQIVKASPKKALAELADLSWETRRLESAKHVQGLALAQSKRWRECLEVCDAALRADPAIRSHRPEIFGLKARCWWELGDFNKAADCARESLVDAPENLSVHYLLLQSLLSAGRPADAYLEALLPETRTPIHHYVAVVCSLSLVDDWPDKPPALLAMERQFPNDSWTLLAAGHYQLERGKLGVAVREFSRAVDLGSLEAKIHLAWVYSSLMAPEVSQTAAAERFVKEFLDSESTATTRHGLAHLVSSTVYARAGRWADAMDAVERADSSSENLSATCKELMALYQMKKEYNASSALIPIGPETVLSGFDLQHRRDKQK